MEETTPARLRALSKPEAALVGAMADRVFPRDGDSPSASEIGFVTYLDGQLAGGWGAGERFYRQGPFVEPEIRVADREGDRRRPPALRRPRPDLKDAFGDPLLRVTFDWEANERNMVKYLGVKVAEIMKAMNPAKMVGGPGALAPHFDTVPYQSTHVTGGTIMGDDPGETVVNDYLQMWDFPNVFVVGASNYPQNAGFNPTGTLGGLAYRAADGIVNHYRKSPGPIRS
jgi:choline dehydrogenase-like flavoprotein